MSWTEKRIAELRSHFEAGVSIRDIARRMEVVSPGSIVGKLHRLGLKRGRMIRHPDAKPRRARQNRKQPTPVVDSSPRKPSPARPPSPPIGLMELRNWTCRWPIGEGPYLFCGVHEADAAKGISYCIAHSRMAYRRPGEREDESDLRRTNAKKQLLPSGLASNPGAEWPGEREGTA